MCRFSRKFFPAHSLSTASGSKDDPLLQTVSQADEESEKRILDRVSSRYNEAGGFCCEKFLRSGDLTRS